jgi:hypothetical protein
MELLRKSLIALSVVSLLSVGSLSGDEAKDTKDVKNPCFAYQPGNRDASLDVNIKNSSDVNRGSNVNRGIDNKNVVPKVDNSRFENTKQTVPVIEKTETTPVVTPAK